MIPLFDGSYARPMEHWIRHRCVSLNRNFLGVFTGDTGGGKSYSAVSLGESTDPRFTIANVHTSAKEMLDFLIEKHRPKGTAIVLDEAGVNLSSRKWMTAENKALGELFQTFRYMNLAVYMTLPNFTFLDVQQRKLVHFSYEDPIINRQHRLCVMKPFHWNHDSFSDKFDKYSPILVYPNGKICRVKKVAFNLASKGLLDDYESKKLTWNTSKLEETRKILYGQPTDKQLKKQNNEDDWIVKYDVDAKMLKVANEIKANLDEYLEYRGKKSGWKFSNQTIHADFNLKGVEVVRVNRFLLKKPEVIEYITSKNELAKSQQPETKVKRLEYDI